MIDISPECGLPIQLDNINHKLILDESLMGGESDVRKLEELQPVLYQKNFQGPKELYTLFNDVGLPEARKLLSQHGLRYDVGIIPPLKIGREYIKTMGHYHCKCSETSISYAEVYEIVYGIAHFILQKQDKKNDKVITDIMWVEAEKGDRLIMPPDYAHVTINPCPEVLVVSNLAAISCRHSYSKIVQMGGLAYFNIEEENSPIFVRNPRYEKVPPLRKVSLKKLKDFGISPDRPIYSSALNEPQEFRFIATPQDFLHLFNKIIY